MRIAWLVMLVSIFAVNCLGQETKREILPIGNGLFRVTSGTYHSMYWVTDDGIVVIDTIDHQTASWLKEELAARHDRPVRYVIYSHNHHDHVYGGEVFDDPGVVFIAHELARDDLKRSRAKTRLPDLTFTEELTLHLGGESLRLRYHGTNNGRGSISMHFVDRGVMFVVDWIVIGRMPWKNLEGYDIEGMIRSTKQILGLKWDTLIGGHADIGDRADVERYLAYLEALYAAVRDGILAGKSLEVLQKEIRLDAFSDLKQYEQWLPLNVEGVYKTLVDVSYIRMRPEVAQEPHEHD